MSTIWKKRLKIMVMMGIPLGMVLLMMQYYLDLSQAQMLRYYTWGSIITITVSILLAMYFQIRLSNTVMAAQKELKESGDIDRYIGKLEQLVNKAFLEQNKNILKLNMSIGYVDKKDYKSAVEVLESINAKALKGDLKVIYYNNLVHYYFRLGENDRAIDIMEDHQAQFDAMEKKPQYCGGFMLNRALKMIAEGDTKEALDLLEDNEDLFLDNHLSESYEFVLSRV